MPARPGHIPHNLELTTLQRLAWSDDFSWNICIPQFVPIDSGAERPPQSQPMRRAEQVPSGGESDHGEALEEVDLPRW
jgi:hypothetical protein